MKITGGGKFPFPARHPTMVGAGCSRKTSVKVEHFSDELEQSHRRRQRSEDPRQAPKHLNKPTMANITAPNSFGPDDP
jgi:hypothetical protein